MHINICSRNLAI